MVAKNAKFKDGVYGFIWEQNGTVGEIFTEPLSDKDIQLIYRVIDEDHELIVDDEDFLNCFCDSNDDRLTMLSVLDCIRQYKGLAKSVVLTHTVNELKAA